MNKKIIGLAVLGIFGASYASPSFHVIVDAKKHHYEIGTPDSGNPTPDPDDDFLTGADIEYVSLTGSGSMALDKDKNIWVTGYNNNYEFGLGNNTGPFIGWHNTNENRFNKIINGTGNTFGITSSGELWSVGSNYFGVLGIGSTSTKRGSWTQTKGITSNVVDVKPGSQFTMALDSSGKVWVAGINAAGQLGLGIPPTQSLCYTEYASICDIGNGSPAQSHLLEFVESKTLPVKAKQIAALGTAGFALSESGEVWAVGSNANYEMEEEPSVDYVESWKKTSITNIAKIFGGSHTIYAVNKSGKLFAMGGNQRGQIGDNKANGTRIGFWYEIPNVSNVKKVYGGNQNAHLLTNDGKVYSIGYNYQGLLGLGDETDKATWTLNTNIDDVFTIGNNISSFHVLTLDKDGVLHGTGKNDGGRMGNKTTSPSYFTTWTITDQPEYVAPTP